LTQAQKDYNTELEKTIANLKNEKAAKEALQLTELHN